MLLRGKCFTVSNIVSQNLNEFEGHTMSRSLIGYVTGVIVFVTTLIIWYLAELHHIPTGPIIAFAVPVVGALFLGQSVASAADAAKQAAAQTNGAMDARIKAAAATALSERDQARAGVLPTVTYVTQDDPKGSTQEV